MSELLCQKDKICEFRKGNEHSDSEQHKVQTTEGVNVNPVAEFTEQHKLQKEMDALQLALQNLIEQQQRAVNHTPQHTGKPNLTLPVLRRILRAHYQERGTTELHKQLASEAKSSKETPLNFLIRCLDLRQKILFASQEAESSLKYDPVLVQSMFLHTVLTGLQNDNIRSDLKPYLTKIDASDELLFDKINIACANEMERQNKKKLLAQQHPKLHSVQTTEVSAERKEKTCHKSTEKREPDILSELKEIRTEMALLKDLSVEVSQIKESIRQPQAMPPQCSTRVRDQAFPSLPQSAYPSQGYEQPYGRRGEAFQRQQ